MASSTVEISVETRERLRALGGNTCDETIGKALDALEADRFWADVDAAAAWRRSLPNDDRQRLVAHEHRIDAAFDGIE